MAWQDKFSRDEFHREVFRLVYEQGLSASRAAAVIGHGCTKNMCIRAMQSIQGKGSRTVTFPDSVWPSTTKSKEAKPETPTREVPVHLSKVVDGQCRAPLWPDFLGSTEKVPTSDHMLCGHPTIDGSAHCAEHHALFYPKALQTRVVKPKKQGVVDNTRHFR